MICIDRTVEFLEERERPADLLAAHRLLDQLKRLPVAITEPHLGNPPLILLTDKTPRRLDLGLDDYITGKAIADLADLYLLLAEICSTEMLEKIPDLPDTDLLRDGPAHAPDRQREQKSYDQCAEK